jgi:hypothetical protein
VTDPELELHISMRREEQQLIRVDAFDALGRSGCASLRVGSSAGPGNFNGASTPAGGPALALQLPEPRAVTAAARRRP